MNNNSSLNPEFDAYAEDYDAALQRGLSVSGETKDFFAQGRMAWVHRRLQDFHFQPKSALDFGCGTGTSVPLLLGLGKMEEVMGVEVSKRSIEVARKLNPSKAVRFSLIADLDPAGRFDLAFCNGVFHHIPAGKRGQALDYVFQSLRPGGLFAFWENNPWNPGTRWIMSRIPFDRDAITLSAPEARDSLCRAGFEILRTDFLFFFPRALAWFRCLEPSLVRVPLGAQYLVLARRPVK